MLVINGWPLDDPRKPFIIAEASGNHAQDYAKAEALVHAAVNVGANAVKFQTFTPEELCADVPILFGHDAAHDAWVQSQGVTRLRDLMKGGLPRAWHAPLKALADSLGITFLSTPFSVDAAKFLVEEIGVPALKIASFDLTFTLLLEYAASTGLPVILSTGGATFEEVQHAAWHVLADIYETRLVLMHCMALYPCQAADANLRAIQTLKGFGCPVGWSDHTLSITTVPSLAVALGASVIEKHIRLEGDTTSVDAGHALMPQHFAAMVDAVRGVHLILGDGEKQPHPREMHERLWARRGADGLRPTEEARAGRWA